MWVCVCVRGQHRFLQYFTLLYWFIHWFPHRLVHSFPMCPVKQYHLTVKLHHSYNQYVGLGSVCVCSMCASVWEVGMGVCVYMCVCLYICARQILVFHSSPNGLCRFPHSLVCPQSICSWERVKLTISLLLLHSQYRRHHLDLSKHRSVCGVGGDMSANKCEKGLVRTK